VASGNDGSIKAHYDCIKAFSETDFREDLKSVDIPVLVMHGEDDQIVPFQLSAVKSCQVIEERKAVKIFSSPIFKPDQECSGFFF